MLIGEIDDAGVAAVSLSNGRVIADPSPRCGHLTANLRVRAVSIWAHESSPSLRDRLLGGLPVWQRAVSAPVSASAPDDREFEQEGVLVNA